MKKTLRNLLLVCLVITSLVAVALFAACDNANKTPVTYTVIVENEEHTPLKGVMLYFQKGKTSYDEITTGEDGKATMELPANTYDVKFVAATIPDGYKVPENVQVTKTETTKTVTLEKIFRFTAKLVNEDGTPFYHERVMLAICPVGGEGCLTGSYLGTDGTWTYDDADPGEYRLQIQLPDEIEGLYAFAGSETGHYYAGGNFSAENTEMTITMKAVSSQLNVSTASTYQVTVLSARQADPDNNVEADFATIRFIPTGTNATGKYEIYSEGNYDTRVEYSTSTQAFYKADEEDDDSGEGTNFKLGGLQIQQEGNGLQFRIFVKPGAQFPATFNVTIRRTGNADTKAENTYTKVEAEHLGTTKFEATAGTTYKSIDATKEQNIVLGADNFFHIGSETGPVLVAKLSGFSDGSEEGTGIPAKFLDMDDATHTHYWDYVEFWEAYNKLTNDDGVYPVNEEIRTMLERYAAQYITQYKNTIPGNPDANIPDGNEWLKICGYYAEESTEVRNDVIVGEYLSAQFMDNTTLSVKANGTYVIKETMGTNTGTWVNNGDGTYTFTDDDEEWGATYNVTRNSDGSLTFYDDMDPDFPAYEFNLDAIVGEYKYENRMLNQSKTLTVNADGTYDLDGTTGTWVKNEDGSYTFTEDGDWGDIFTVKINSEDGSLSFWYEGLEEDEPEFVYEVKE